MLLSRSDELVSEKQMLYETYVSTRSSEQTSRELLDRANELRRMAKTARTEADVQALEKLADRYAALAKLRKGM